MAILDSNEIFFTAFEPKQANRFIMYIDGIPSYEIKGVSAITLNSGTVQLNHINVQRYVKGITKWDPITFTLFDPITPSGAQAVMEWVRLHHESVTGRDGYSDMYKKDLTFNVLGPVGDIVSECSQIFASFFFFHIFIYDNKVIKNYLWKTKNLNSLQKL